MPHPTRTGYRLTADLVAAHGGGPVVCLAATAIGQVFTGLTTRPGAEFNQRLTADYAAAIETVPGVLESAAVEASPVVVRVDISGPIAQRCTPRGECNAFVEGHDNIAEKMIAALEVGDVLLVFDTPGGAYAGGMQAIAQILEAKAAHGRRVTGWVDELCASMGAWYAYALCDDIFVPIAGAIGSIGARSAHGSVAGALAQAGIAVTFACWPNDGKIAGVAELPLSDVGRDRMQQGVDEAGEQFAASVAASPYGVRHGLTRDAIVSLSADCLSGARAVAAGLADGVATFADVKSYALAMAANAGDTTMSLTAGDDPEKKDPPGEPDAGDDGDAPEPEGEEPSTACAACSCANEPNAKFCDQCGESMAAKPDDADDAPESSKRPGAVKPAALTPPKAMSPSASLAAILGATGTSDLAVRTAAIQMRQIRDTAAGVTGQSAPDRIVGSLLSVPSRLSAAAQIVADRKVEQAAKVKSDKAAKFAADKAERLALAKRGIASGAPEMARGKVYRDIVGDDGKRTGVALQPWVTELSLGTLRGMVEGYEASAPRANPFEPDKARSEAGARQAGGTASPIGADGKPTATAIEVAKKDPTVIKMFHAPGNKHSLETIAGEYVINAVANGITIGSGQ